LACKLELKQEDKLNLENMFADYIGMKHCKVFPSARIALYFSLKALNLPPGTKILMPPITIKPMLDVIYGLNLEPVFVDLDKENFAFDLDDLERKISSDTRVLFLTYLFGSVPDITRITEIVKENSLILIEDFSQAIGATFHGKKIGSYGAISIYSSSSIKTLDSLGGGFAVTNDSNLDAELLQSQRLLLAPKRSILVKKAFSNLVRNIGTQTYIFSLLTANLLKILRRIDQASANRMTGTRAQSPLGELPKDWFRGYSQVQCRIAIQQFSGLSRKLNLRIENAKHILGKNMTAIFEPSKLDVYWQLCVLSKDIDKVFKSAIKNKIDISQTSLSLISENNLYSNYLHCPNAIEIYNNSFFVPCYPQLTGAQLDRLRIWLGSIE
jgi:dTDP-4-amino-4,6-dideoxygalactose transaminase